MNDIWRIQKILQQVATDSKAWHELGEGLCSNIMPQRGMRRWKQKNKDAAGSVKKMQTVDGCFEIGVPRHYCGVCALLWHFPLEKETGSKVHPCRWRLEHSWGIPCA